MESSSWVGSPRVAVQYMESSSSWVGSPRVAVHWIFFFCRVTSFIILKVLSQIGVAQQWKNLSKTNKNCQLCRNYCCTATGLEQHSLWLWLWLNDCMKCHSKHSQYGQNTNQCMKYHSKHSQYGQNTNQCMKYHSKHSQYGQNTNQGIKYHNNHSQFGQNTNQCMKYHSKHPQFGQNTNQVWSITTMLIVWPEH